MPAASKSGCTQPRDSAAAPFLPFCSWYGYTRCVSIFFLVEGALYYERDTKLSEPNAPNTPSLVTVGPNSGDDIVIMIFQSRQYYINNLYNSVTLVWLFIIKKSQVPRGVLTALRAASTVHGHARTTGELRHTARRRELRHSAHRRRATHVHVWSRRLMTRLTPPKLASQNPQPQEFQDPHIIEGVSGRDLFTGSPHNSMKGARCDIEQLF